MLRFGGYLLQFHLGRKTINIPDIFSGVHGLTGKTVNITERDGHINSNLK